ncbi:hypothetical protein [Winogradskyella sp. A3E31]|uniref:hypothetical protein n=1 Tax=Winogradskyella sp. A3E31 TaxID=3349637 RepID=UPI00398A7695
MKHKALLFLLTLGLITACSSSDDSNTPSEPIEGNYYPSSANNTWIYNVDNSSTSNPELDYTGTDLVTINSETGSSFTINVNSDTSPEFGLMNAILNTGTLTRSASTLALNGELPLPAELDFLSETSLTLTNFLLYDLNAGINSGLSTLEGVLNETIDIDGSSFPLTAVYSITNTRTSNVSSINVDGETFTDVITSEITLNLDLSTTVVVNDVSTNVTIIESQDVLVIKNYFAEDIGLIKSEANQTYTLDANFVSILDLLGLTLDFPTTLSVSNTQDIDSYVVN